LIVDPEAVCRHSQGRERFHETRCQAPEAANAERRVLFRVGYLLQVKTHLPGYPLRFCQQAQIEQIVAQRLADEELCREVNQALRLFPAEGLLALESAIDSSRPQRMRQRLTDVLFRRFAPGVPDGIAKVIFESFAKRSVSGRAGDSRHEIPPSSTDYFGKMVSGH
jgi:hypothetical protein